MSEERLKAILPNSVGVSEYPGQPNVLVLDALVYVTRQQMALCPDYAALAKIVDTATRIWLGAIRERAEELDRKAGRPGVDCRHEFRWSDHVCRKCGLTAGRAIEEGPPSVVNGVPIEWVDQLPGKSPFEGATFLPFGSDVLPDVVVGPTPDAPPPR